jgi:hypothetical protein
VDLEKDAVCPLVALTATARHARNPRRAVTNFETRPHAKPVAFTPNAVVLAPKR